MERLLSQLSYFCFQIVHHGSGRWRTPCAGQKLTPQCPVPVYFSEGDGVVTQTKFLL
jgi:hypothetical protein